MTRIEEIARKIANEEDGIGFGPNREDTYFLLAEVKRLEGDVSEDDGVRAVWRRRTQEAEALALSLAEALDTLKLWSLATSEPLKKQKRDEVLAMVDAALSSPALLKLKGGV